MDGIGVSLFLRVGFVCQLTFRRTYSHDRRTLETHFT